MRFLPSYTVYLLEHPNTFLPWFLGCYESSSKKSGTLRVVVMGNVCGSSLRDAVPLHELYDLKGSKYGRSSSIVARPSEEDSDVLKNAKKAELLTGGVPVSLDANGNLDSPVCHKDLDWQAFGRQLLLSNKDRIAMLQQLEMDSSFLAKNNIMDYSLLLGISYGDLFEDFVKENAKREARRMPWRPVSTAPPDKLFKRVPDEHCPTERADDEKHVLFAMLAAFLFSLFTSIRSALQFVAAVGQRRRKLCYKTPSRFKRYRGGVRAHGMRSWAQEAFFRLWRRVCLSLGLPSEWCAAPRPAPAVYYVGIIDVLQEYTLKKRVESVVKGATLGGRSAISAVGPYYYAERFRTFIRAYSAAQIIEQP